MVPPIRQEAEPRRHHYVPQCWLAGFTETGENDGRLWVTDFSRQRQWPATPANAGHIRDFYRLSDPAPDPVVVEKFFSLLARGPRRPSSFEHRSGTEAARQRRTGCLAAFHGVSVGSGSPLSAIRA